LAFDICNRNRAKRSSCRARLELLDRWSGRSRDQGLPHGRNRGADSQVAYITEELGFDSL
jgi:hypothetical protein